MTTDFLHHVQRNWPLALAAGLMLAYLPVVLISGTFYSNQGSVLRSREPERYWRWVRNLCLLLTVALAVLIGTYLIAQ